MGLVPWAAYGRRGVVAGLLAPYGRRGGVPVPLGPVWLPRGHGRSPGPRIAAVELWPVPWARMVAVGAWWVSCVPYGRRGGVVGVLGLVWKPWGVASSLDLVYPPLGRGRSLIPVWPPWGMGGPVGPVWPPWGRGGCPGPRMATVKAWPNPWALYGRRGGESNPLGAIWPLRGRGRSPGPRIAAVDV